MPYQLNRNLLCLLLQRERPQAPQIQLLQLQKQSPLQIFSSGYEYTVTGVGVSMGEADSISPGSLSINETLNGQTHTWTGLDLNNKPDWTVSDGDAFQFTETYVSPGLQNITVIQRNIESESVITTTSVFSQ